MSNEEPLNLTTRILVEIRDEVRGLRTEMHDQIGGLRTEMHDQVGGLRTELRAEMREQIGGLRTEMHDEIGGLRGEVRAEMRGMGVTLKQILEAVQYGDAQRDQTVTDHEARIRRLEERTGIA